MTNRDPLYDANSPAAGDPIDDLLTERNTGRMPSGKSGNQNQGKQMQEKGRKAADQAKNKAEEMGSKVQDKAENMGAKAQNKADKVGAKAEEKADEGMHKAASGLNAAANKLRDEGDQQGGKAEGYANTVADKLESASGYMRQKDSDQMLTDLEDLVRRKPMESLLAAAGIGLLLSRIIK